MENKFGSGLIGAAQRQITKEEREEMLRQQSPAVLKVFGDVEPMTLATWIRRCGHGATIMVNAEGFLALHCRNSNEIYVVS